MSETLQEGFDNLYRRARELTIMLGRFSERTLTEKLGTPVTALPLAATMALESKWASEPRLPEETIDGRIHDIAGILFENARAQQRREVIEELLTEVDEHERTQWLDQDEVLVLRLFLKAKLPSADAGTEAQS